MLFNSDIFIFVFLPIVFGGFILLQRLGRPTLVVVWLVLASLYFYGWWNPRYLLLILFSVVFNYRLGSVLHRIQNGSQKGVLLFCGVAANLALIGYFKYAGFLTENFNSVIGTRIDIGTIVLPLAISFFTFQQISFLVDAFRGDTPRYRFLHYCLYVTFFPQLIAGPIVYHREMLPQLAARVFMSTRWRYVASGMTIFLIGLSKKVLIADQLSLYVTPVFDAPAGTSIDFVSAWTASLAYTFQLYFDFSGYCDMAVGLARLFGIRLPFNFNSPYKAASIIDFWRRWHITLSRFLRDYLYIPLGGNRRGRLLRYVNLLITMGLGGLWHGASWNFVIWGLFHGVLLALNHLWRALVPEGRLPWLFSRIWGNLTARVLTFFVVVIGWVVFRAPDLATAGVILEAMFTNFDATALDSVEILPLALIGAAACIAFWAPNSQEWLALRPPAGAADRVRHAFLPRWRPSPLIACTVAIVGFASVYKLRGTSEFLYFQF